MRSFFKSIGNAKKNYTSNKEKQSVLFVIISKRNQAFVSVQYANYAYCFM